MDVYENVEKRKCRKRRNEMKAEKRKDRETIKGRTKGRKGNNEERKEGAEKKQKKPIQI